MVRKLATRLDRALETARWMVLRQIRRPMGCDRIVTMKNTRRTVRPACIAAGYQFVRDSPAAHKGRPISSVHPVASSHRLP
jgi:hypothetical protein